MRGKFGKISNERGKINFILTAKVNLKNKSKLKGIFDPLLKKGQK